jgi:hypothetical protein
MEIRSTETIKQAVMAGMGVSFLSAHTVSRELQSGSLVVLDVEGFPLMLNWYVVHLRNKRLLPVTQAFKDYLLEDGAALIADIVPFAPRRGWPDDAVTAGPRDARAAQERGAPRGAPQCGGSTNRERDFSARSRCAAVTAACLRLRRASPIAFAKMTTGSASMSARTVGLSSKAGAALKVCEGRECVMVWPLGELKSEGIETKSRVNPRSPSLTGVKFPARRVPDAGAHSRRAARLRGTWNSGNACFSVSTSPQRCAE